MWRVLMQKIFFRNFFIFIMKTNHMLRFDFYLYFCSIFILRIFCSCYLCLSSRRRWNVNGDFLLKFFYIVERKLVDFIFPQYFILKTFHMNCECWTFWCPFDVCLPGYLSILDKIFKLIGSMNWVVIGLFLYKSIHVDHDWTLDIVSP